MWLQNSPLVRKLECDILNLDYMPRPQELCSPIINVINAVYARVKDTVAV